MGMRSKPALITAALCAVFLVYAGATVTVVKKGQEAQLTGEVAFDPESVAKRVWQEQLADYFDEKAVDFVTLSEEARGDFKALGHKYGHYAMGENGDPAFVVKGTAEVTEVKNKLRAGYVKLKIDGYKGDAEIRMQIGPVFKGSAVRDSISLINYKDYRNQIEWAQVSVAFHNLIFEEILRNMDMGSLAGRKIEFTGCFTPDRASRVTLTPVRLKVL